MDALNMSEKDQESAEASPSAMSSLRRRRLLRLASLGEMKNLRALHVKTDDLITYEDSTFAHPRWGRGRRIRFLSTGEMAGHDKRPSQLFVPRISVTPVGLRKSFSLTGDLECEEMGLKQL
ncbi:uncharacterized protein LOC124255026 [Haliotis rubra]|uniref:uncharacterized protein LOC124255026 n=1 Tax=Haliotis rubra TaxID=36100 RepID=UPI001EE54FD6|nr:uncharacterized protein LOC124255026 [Haliotis rubra]